MDDVLFLGNGINAFSTGYDWNQLITKLSTQLGVDSYLHIQNAPFPLTYEELFFKSIKKEHHNESKMKKIIADETLNFNPNEVHRKIMNSGINEIITSNYDYNLQKVITSELKTLTNKGIVKEKKYSLFRYQEFGGKKIWHMHGEVNNPQSIILGYEQYVGNLQRMRNYVVNGTGSFYKGYKKGPLIRRLANLNTIYSWLDLFFIKNIHLIGMRLDFEETDLWWLLTFRARLKYYQRSPEIRNKIYYYVPEQYESRSSTKLALMKSIGIEVRVIDQAHNTRYYSSIIDQIENS